MKFTRDSALMQRKRTNPSPAAYHFFAFIYDTSRQRDWLLMASFCHRGCPIKRTVRGIRDYFCGISQFSGAKPSAQVDIDAPQADPGPVGSLRRVAVGQQPLVPGPQELVLRVLFFQGGLGRIGAQGQGHRHPEAFCAVHMAGRIMQGRGIDLHHRARRGLKSLHLLRVQLQAFPDLLLPGQQQDEILRASLSRWYSRQFSFVLCPQHMPSWMGMPP